MRAGTFKSSTWIGFLLLWAMTQQTMQTQPQPAPGPPVPFQAAFHIADALSVQYHIQNTRSRPIYLFNVLWDMNDQGDYIKAPQAAYVSIKGGRGVHVTQQILPVPKGVRVELRNVPFTTKVDPGQVFTGTVTLPLPVKEYSAYFPEKPDTKSDDITAEAALFTLQFVEELPGMTAKPSPIGGLHVTHPQLLAHIETVQSQPFRARIPAKKRLDKFEDF